MTQPRGRPRDARVDQAILDAALAQFVQGGVEAASIEQVARRARVTRASIYRRWRTRDAMLTAALTSVRERAEAPIADGRPLSLDVVIAWFVATAPKELASPRARKLLAHLVGSVPAHPGLMRKYWNDTLGRRWAAFAAVLRARRSDVDADVLADVLAGALLWRVVVRPGRRTEQDVRRYLIEVLRLLGVAHDPRA